MLKSIRHLLPGLFILLAPAVSSVCKAEDERPAIFKATFEVGGQFYDYQNYQNVPYFHGGLDLCAVAGTEVFTPVSGLVEVNDYKITASIEPHVFSYARRPVRQGESLQTRYLEVAITATDGKKWMFRHVEPSSIPAAIFRCIETKKPVEKGSLIGRVGGWLQPVLPEKRLFDHIHLEILDSDGNYQNPARFVKTTKDYYPPVLHNLFAVKHSTNEAFPLKTGEINTISGDIDLVAAITDRMNRAAYQHSIYAASWSLQQIAADGTATTIEQHQAFKFDTLPFKGERVQLSKVIYRENLSTKTGKIQANGNSGPRFFLVNITSGTVSGGYSADNCLQTEKYPSGLYRLNITIEDGAGNNRQQSYSIRIQN